MHSSAVELSKSILEESESSSVFLWKIHDTLIKNETYDNNTNDRFRLHPFVFLYILYIYTSTITTPFYVLTNT